MFVACGIWCLADVSSVSPSSEQTANPYLTYIIQAYIGSVCNVTKALLSVLPFIKGPRRGRGRGASAPPHLF